MSPSTFFGFAPVRCVGGCWTVSLPYLAGSLSRLAPLGYYLEPGTELTGSVESAGARGTGNRASRSEEKKCESRG